MDDAQNTHKQAAATAALDLVRSGMRLGLGTGSTAFFLVAALGKKLSQGRLTDIEAVPTSAATAELARSAGIKLTTLDAVRLDLAIDGCDEIDPELRAIKGLGGALLREKIVAEAADVFVLIADDSKRVRQLGELAALPIEVVQFGWLATRSRIERLGGETRRRIGVDGQPILTDNGNFIIDWLHDDEPFDAATVDEALKSITGVVEHGLFLHQASRAFVAGENGVARLVRK